MQQRLSPQGPPGPPEGSGLVGMGFKGPPTQGGGPAGSPEGADEPASSEGVETSRQAGVGGPL